MSIDELIAEMPKDGWRLSAGQLRRLENGYFCCPITCGLRGQPPLSSVEARLTRMALGMTAKDSLRIIKAADGVKGHSKRLRARLLEAVGLKEPTP